MFIYLTSNGTTLAISQHRAKLCANIDSRSSGDYDALHSGLARASLRPSSRLHGVCVGGWSSPSLKPLPRPQRPFGVTALIPRQMPGHRKPCPLWGLETETVPPTPPRAEAQPAARPPGPALWKLHVMATASRKESLETSFCCFNSSSRGRGGELPPPALAPSSRDSLPQSSSKNKGRPAPCSELQGRPPSAPPRPDPLHIR